MTAELQQDRIVEDAPRRLGRPRSERSKNAIINATIRFLEQDNNGLDRLSIEQLAVEAGVGKATVYRWWPTKTSLIVDAFVQMTAHRMQHNDSGSLAEDLKIQMRRLARLMSTPRGRMLGKILAASQSDDVLRQAFCEHYIMPLRKQTTAALQRGIERGELPAIADLDAIIDSLFGPMYFRLVLWRTPPSEEWAESLCRRVLCGAQIADAPKSVSTSRLVRKRKNAKSIAAKATRQ